MVSLLSVRYNREEVQEVVRRFRLYSGEDMVRVTINRETWDKIVDNSSSKIYHRYDWGKLLNEVHGHRLIYIWDNEGVFPLAYVKSIIFKNRLISLPFADYGGPCTNHLKTADSLVTQAEIAAMDLDVDFIEIRSPNEEFHQIFYRHGFLKRNDYFTYVLSLNKNIDDLWDTIGKKNRNMVRKAEKNNVEIVKAKNQNDLKIFYALYLKTMKKLGSPPQPYQFFKTLWTLFYPGGIILLLAKHEDKYISGSLYFLHKNTIHHSYNCSLPDYESIGQNNLIQWHIIEWGSQNGFTSLDFGRTRKNAGNVLFKKRWNGELKLMPYFYKFYKKELKQREEIRYERLSNIWAKYMPEILANKIGPKIIRHIG